MYSTPIKSVWVLKLWLTNIYNSGIEQFWCSHPFYVVYISIKMNTILLNVNHFRVYSSFMRISLTITEARITHRNCIQTMAYWWIINSRAPKTNTNCNRWMKQHFHDITWFISSQAVKYHRRIIIFDDTTKQHNNLLDTCARLHREARRHNSRWMYGYPPAPNPPVTMLKPTNFDI